LKFQSGDERAHWLQPTPLPTGFYSMESNFKLKRFVDNAGDGNGRTAEYSYTDVCVADHNQQAIPQ